MSDRATPRPTRPAVLFVLIFIALAGCRNRVRDLGDDVIMSLPVLQPKSGGEMVLIPAGAFTMGDLINAINVDLPTNAQVTASLDNTGHLVITSRHTSDIIVIGGGGTDQANLGFGVANKEFMPVTPTASSSDTSSSSSSSSRFRPRSSTRRSRTPISRSCCA